MCYLLYCFEKGSAWVFGTSIHSFMWVYFLPWGNFVAENSRGVGTIRYFGFCISVPFWGLPFYVFLSFDLCGSLSFFQDISGLGAKGIQD